MWIFWVAILLTLALAVGLIAVVAISAGRLQGPRVDKFEHVAQAANRHLNGQGTPPKVFERLDQLHQG